MAAAVKLSDLPVGAAAVVVSLAAGGSLRLKEMGLLAGTSLTLVRCAPMGDPMEIKIRGYHLTLRKSEAATVMVEPKAP